MKYTKLNDLLSFDDIKRFGKECSSTTYLAEGKLKALFDDKYVYKQYYEYKQQRYKDFLKRYPKLDYFRELFTMDFCLPTLLKYNENGLIETRFVQGFLAFSFIEYFVTKYKDIGVTWPDFLEDDMSIVNDEILDKVSEYFIFIHSLVLKKIERIKQTMAQTAFPEQYNDTLIIARKDSKMLRFLIQNVKEIVRAFGAEIDDRLFNVINIDKFELLIASGAAYLVLAEVEGIEERIDEQEKEEAIQFLERYFALTEYLEERSGKPYEVQITHQGQVIRYKDVKEMLKEHYEQNKSYFDEKASRITIEEILDTQLVDAKKKLRKEDIETHLQLNWNLVPYGEGEQKLPATWIAQKNKMAISKDERNARDYELLQEKEEFYPATNPRYIIDGRDAYNGYGGYIYENGLVVLEKFQVEKGKEGEVIPVHQEGFVIMKAHDLLEMSKYSKTELMELIRLGKNKSAQRKYHSKLLPFR